MQTAREKYNVADPGRGEEVSPADGSDRLQRRTGMDTQIGTFRNRLDEAFEKGHAWVLLQIRMRLRYVVVLVVAVSVLVPVLGQQVWLPPVTVGGNLPVPRFSDVFVGTTFDPVVFFGGVGLLGIYWRVGRTEYQLRHQLYEDIMLVPLTEAGDRYGDPAGSQRAVQFEMDRSVLVLGETGSGKTEAIKVLAHQLQAEPDEAFVVFDYKQDYRTFFPAENVVRLSSDDSDVIWNVFEEIEDDGDCDEIAKAIFVGAEVDNDYFTNAATQVLADVLRLLRIRADRSDVEPSNEDLVKFLNDVDVDHLREGFIEENLSSKKHFPATVEASSNIVSILEERVKTVFRGDFSKDGSFSVRKYMADPDGQILLLDFPIQQSASVQPIFRLLIDWSIRFGLDDERDSYYILDEFAALPELDMLERLINAGGAYNCYAILGVQAIPQLRDTYGTDKADSLLSGLAQEIHLRVGQGSVEYCRKRIGREHVERNVGPDDDERLVEVDDDIRVFEEYPIEEDTLQNFEAGRGIVHTPSGRQRGRLYLLDAISGRLLPADRPGLAARLWGRLIGREPRRSALEEREPDRQPRLEERRED
ncbi:type IV secretory system conjugative DNA transfer family protein [Halocatena salina]|uniref:Type IV secretion system DNA-binding domain-containing protein n=1 Tax=Halocatena salina TaxID=2934340 RepID=A0A8U0A770_9EURY|nr:type IV secretion system DNA-binding domain-containing protein [Halocatena salina]UPM43833.1 type IV secretion system DNA-binding domain-containing protein [Halocatena salina]